MLRTITLMVGIGIACLLTGSYYLRPFYNSIGIYISNEGNDNNSGESAASPKQTISASEAMFATGQFSNVSINLQCGNLFREQLDAVTGTNVTTYYNTGPSYMFARISGMEAHNSGWSATAGYANLFGKNIAHSINIHNAGYHYLVVYEIDTMLEKTAPFAARRLMPLASSLADANNTNGSYYTGPLDAPQEMVYLNSSDNAAPGTGKYRYEVTVRHFAVTGENKIQLEKLIIEPSGHGYGNSLGDSTLIRQCIFNGYGTHAVVFGSGVIEKNLFIQGAKGLAQGSIPIVHFRPDGTGSRSRFSGNIFLGTQTGPYVHQSGTSFGYHEEAVFEGNYFFGDSGYSDNAFAGDLIRKAVVKNNYAENVWKYWSGVATDLTIEGNVFNNIPGRSGVNTPSDLTVRTVMHNNLIKTSGNNHDTSEFYANVFFFINSNVTLNAQHNIFHLKSDRSNVDVPVSLFTTLGANTKYSKNIIICDVPPGKLARTVVVDKIAPGQFAADSNVYVLVRGKGFLWTVMNTPGGNLSTTSFSEWQAQSGQDRASRIIDLRDNPNGIKDLFVNPEKGNYHFANTKEADTVKALLAGMITPPYAFPVRPSSDEAAIALMQSPAALPDCNVLSIDSVNKQIRISGVSQAPAAVVEVFDENGTGIFHREYINPPAEVYIPVWPGEYTARINFFTSNWIPVCERTLRQEVRYKVDTPVTRHVAIGPNPFVNAFVVTIQSEQEDRAELSIWDLSGRQLTTRTARLQRGLNRIYINELNGHPAGSYFLRLSTFGRIEYFKLLKR